MTAPDLHELHLARTAPDDLVDCRLTYADAGTAGSAGALVCSPSPLLGGDMDNNVVRALAEGFAGAGFATLRFDYRAVGASPDVHPGVARFEYWNSVEERGDRAAVQADADDALRRLSRVAPLRVLAGYSFGAWAALDLASRAHPDVPLVLVSPPFGRLDLSPLEEHCGPVLLVVAGQDELTPAPVAHELRARFPRASVVRLPAADHFFLGCEAEVARVAREAHALEIR